MFINCIMVTTNDFSVNIIAPSANSFRKNGGDYCSLKHREEYKLKLSNNRNTKCDAEVFIDNETVGIWRIGSNDSIIIERPVKINRKFTFLKENSIEARQSGISSGLSYNGLVKIVFKPEVKRFYDFSFLNYGSTDEPYNSRGATYDIDNNISLFKNSGLNKYSKSKSTEQLFDCANSADNCFNDVIYEKSPNILTSFSSAPTFSSGATTLGDISHQEFNMLDTITDIDHANITTIHLRLVYSDGGQKPYISLKDMNYQFSNPVPPRINSIFF
jgi:hypothetical protein